MSETSYTQTMFNNSMLDAGNASYVEDLFEAYLHNPQSIPETWQNYFKQFGGEQFSHQAIQQRFSQLIQHRHVSGESTATATVDKQIRVLRLIDAYRKYGHLATRLNPLLPETTPMPEVSELMLATYGLSTADLTESFIHDNIGGLASTASLQQIIQALQNFYCQTIAYEYQHLQNQTELNWLQQQFEQPMPTLNKDQKLELLDALVAADGLEKYIGMKFVGQTRFSIEGGDALLPLLQTVFKTACVNGTNEIVLGMAHRGRLNLLVNLFGKKPQELCNEFSGNKPDSAYAEDVKYHLSGSNYIEIDKQQTSITMLANPSHLEFVNPVVQGVVRAHQNAIPDTDKTKVLPIVIHGDASFAGQGIVMETFNFSLVPGYFTGGTINIISNNQIGYTTNISDSRSGRYCTDVAKMIHAPIIHVNSDDVEAVIHAGMIAMNYRQRFKKDIVIDLVCYRRYGHNEADDPTITQPIIYRSVQKQPTPAQIYAQRLLAQNIITEQTLAELQATYLQNLDQNATVARYIAKKINPELQKNDCSNLGFLVDDLDKKTPFKPVACQTQVTLKTLTDVAKTLIDIPSQFSLRTQVAKEMDARKKMFAGELPLNWAAAEALALATLLHDGICIRFTGEDSARGTFTHRHAVVFDQTTNQAHCPLQILAQTYHTLFEIINTPLTELATMGFEYGYALARPQDLVVWEAQFGDFYNGAQVIVDQFISAGEQKWKYAAPLTLLLPHGLQGEGPEHSSARLERFLQLCAQDNMQVCNPTTPAQYFHLLRRQALQQKRKPLIIMSPKMLLRHKLAVSALEELTRNTFFEVLDEIDPLNVKELKTIVLCSGKVYYELLETRRERKINSFTLIRVEQLYPYPKAQLEIIFKKYADVKNVIWFQEEPQNQGSWHYIEPLLREQLGNKYKIEYVGRGEYASTAAGSKKLHDKQQKSIIEELCAHK